MTATLTSEADQTTGTVRVFLVPDVNLPAAELVAELPHSTATRAAHDLGLEARHAARPAGWVSACAVCSHRRDEPQAERRICASCLALPTIPTGQVRVSPEGTWAVATGNGRLWKVVGEDAEDPSGIFHHGWRSDYDVLGWAVLGSLADLRAGA